MTQSSRDFELVALATGGPPDGPAGAGPIEEGRVVATRAVPRGIFRVPSRKHSEVGLSVIIPTYNEGQNIDEMVSRVTAALDSVLDKAYEIIVVDDNSPDGTWNRAVAISRRYPRLRVIRREHEKGLSTAVVRGWQLARGRVLAVIDGDLQHPPELLVELWKRIEGGADLAAGSRHVSGGGVSNWSLPRRLISRGARFLALMILPEVAGRVTDPMSGCFLVRREVLAGVALDPLGYKILLEVLGRGHVRMISEVGYTFQERQRGRSDVTWKVYLEYCVHLLRLRAARLHSSQRHPMYGRG